MDPYCIVHYGDSNFTSNVHKGGGKKPSWNQFFVPKLTPFPSVLEIEVYDKQLFKSDDFIGRGEHRITKSGQLKV